MSKKTYVENLINAINANDPNITSIVCPRTDLEDADIIRICHAIKQNSYIKSLDLTTDTYVNKNLTVAASMAVASLTSLEEIKLGPNPTITPPYVIAELIKNTNLRSLVFMDCNLEATAIRILAERVSDWSQTLRSLAFSRCGLETESVVLLAQTPLTTLKLSCNRFDLRTDLVAANALATSKNLKKLTLGGEPISDGLTLIASTNRTLDILELTDRYRDEELVQLASVARVKICFENKSIKPALLSHADKIEARQFRAHRLFQLHSERNSQSYFNLISKELMQYTVDIASENDDTQLVLKGNVSRRRVSIEEFKKCIENYSANVGLCFSQIEAMDFSRLQISDFVEDSSASGFCLDLKKIIEGAAKITHNNKDHYIKAEIFRLLDNPTASQKALNYYSRCFPFLCKGNDIALFYDGIKQLNFIPADNLLMNKISLYCIILIAEEEQKKRLNSSHIPYYEMFINYWGTIHRIKNANYLAELVEVINNITVTNNKGGEIKDALLAQLANATHVPGIALQLR